MGPGGDEVLGVAGGQGPEGDEVRGLGQAQRLRLGPLWGCLRSSIMVSAWMRWGHGEGEVAVGRVPGVDLVLVEAEVSLGLLE